MTAAVVRSVERPVKDVVLLVLDALEIVGENQKDVQKDVVPVVLVLVLVAQVNVKMLALVRVLKVVILDVLEIAWDAEDLAEEAVKVTVM